MGVGYQPEPLRRNLDNDTALSVALSVTLAFHHNLTAQGLLLAHSIVRKVASVLTSRSTLFSVN
jgi:hypothetical protein